MGGMRGLGDVDGWDERVGRVLCGWDERVGRCRWVG